MKLVQHYSQVDPSKCVGCHTCERRCPGEAIQVIRPGDCNGFVETPCQKACPAHINVAGYVSLIGEKRFHEAYDLIMKENPFPSVCGRICTHPCESECNRGHVDKAVAIRDLKRFVTDYVYKEGEPACVQPKPSNGKSVGIIGAGPSGMTSAYFLRLLGYEVHVYEEENVAGGVLNYGIPEYRLPKARLQKEIDHILHTGVELHLGCSVGKDITMEDLRKKHDAVYMATGAKFSKKMDIPGEDLKGVRHGLDFLRDVNLGKEVVLGKKAVVVGGGNTAIDVARTLVRLGCKDVTIAYRRGKMDMPAEQIEIKEALEEGIRIEAFAAPIRVLGTDHVAGLECLRTKAVQKDAFGRTGVEFIPDSNFQIECDMLIPAVSQYFDLPFVEKEAFKSNSKGNFVVDEKMMTTIDGVFAGGDMVRGADVAVTAIADGKKAAVEIDLFLGGQGKLYTDKEISATETVNQANMFKRDRFSVEYLPLEQRTNTFDEAVLGFDIENAIAEANRCLRCDAQCKAVVNKDKCLDCAMCVEFCPQNACEMVLRDEPRRVGGLTIPAEHREQIAAWCKEAHLYPMFSCCPCTGATAAEICEAILQGATTMPDLAQMTGIGSGCGGIYCSIEAQMLLKAAGYPVEARDDGFVLPNTLNLYDVTEEVAAQYPTLHVLRDQELNLKPELFKDVDNLFV